MYSFIIDTQNYSRNHLFNTSNYAVWKGWHRQQTMPPHTIYVLTSLDCLLLEHPPTHLLEVVQVQGESLVTLLVQVGQLPEPRPVVLVRLPIKLHPIEANHTSKVLFLSFGPSREKKYLHTSSAFMTSENIACRNKPLTDRSIYLRILTKNPNCKSTYMLRGLRPLVSTYF